MPSSTRPRARRVAREPWCHEAANGFSYEIALPERAAAAIGARKPLAKVIPEGSEPICVPVAVARALHGSDVPEPESRAELLYRIRETADACAWARVVDMVSRREYSSTEAIERLRRDGYSAECAARVVERAQRLRVISDARFAESFVRAKVSAGWGPVRIERELSRKGVEPADVPGWPEEFVGAGDDVSARAREALERKRVPEKNAYPKLVRFLVSRGYSLSVAKDAVSARLAEESESEAGGW